MDREVAEAGHEVLEVALLALHPRAEGPDQAGERVAGGRVEGVDDLVEVDHRLGRGQADDPTVGEVLGAVLPRGELDVLLPEQGGEPDARGGVGGQRPLRVVDVEGDVGMPVPGGDLGHLAHQPAGDAHVAAHRDPVGVGDLRGDGVGPRPGGGEVDVDPAHHQHDPGDDHRGDDAGDARVDEGRAPRPLHPNIPARSKLPPSPPPAPEAPASVADPEPASLEPRW